MFLNNLPGISNNRAEWILNKKSLPDRFNKEILSHSATDRLRYAIWQEVSYSLLLGSSMANVVDRAEKLDKVAGLIADEVKTLVQIAMLDVSVTNPGSVIERISLSADTSKLMVDLLYNQARKDHAIGDISHASAENYAAYVKAVANLSKFNVAGMYKEINGTSLDTELEKVLNSIIGNSLEAANDGLKKWILEGKFSLDPKSIMVDYIHIFVKDFLVKSVLSTYVSTNRTYADAYLFAYNYLEAYYASGGDARFMNDIHQMPHDLNVAASQNVHSDWVEWALGEVPFNKRLLARNIVRRYQAHVEATFSEFSSLIGRFPQDEIGISFSNPRDMWVCQHGFTNDQVNVRSISTSSASPPDVRLEWMISDGLDVLVIGDNINVQFPTAGIYDVQARAYKAGSNIGFSTNKTYVVSLCVEDSPDIDGSGYSISEITAEGISYRANEVQGFEFVGWSRVGDNSGSMVTQDKILNINYAQHARGLYTPRFVKNDFLVVDVADVSGYVWDSVGSALTVPSSSPVMYCFGDSESYIKDRYSSYQMLLYPQGGGRQIQYAFLRISWGGAQCSLWTLGRSV